MDLLPREVDPQRLKAEQKMKQLDEESHLQDLRYRTLLQYGSVWDLCIQLSNTTRSICSCSAPMGVED